MSINRMLLISYIFMGLWVCYGLFLIVLLSSCVSSSSNLARLQAECSVAPLAQIGASFIPVPGAGGVANLTIGAVCANTALIANDEAAIAAALQTLLAKKSGP